MKYRYQAADVYQAARICQERTRTRNPLLSTDGLTTPNASPIETHVNCLNSAGRFHHFSPY